jgi:crossover junction endodeoxyribonuclease RuvC
MVILGVDPGTATTGYGVLDVCGSSVTPVDFGVVRTAASLPAHERLAVVYDRFREMIDRHGVEELATERLFFAKNETTAFAVGRSIGVVLLAAAQRGIRWAEYTPLQVKQAVVGYGAADKSQVQYMVQRILRLTAPPRPDDAADALAVAVCHAHSARLLAAMSGPQP